MQKEYAMYQFGELCGSYRENPENLVEDERNCEKDMRYFRSCYPERARRMVEALCDQCDQLEYNDSCMMAEYPDKETIYRMVEKIYEESQKVGKMDPNRNETYLIAESSMTSKEMEERMEKEMLLVMLCDEMHRRRMRCQRRNQLFCTC